MKDGPAKLNNFAYTGKMVNTPNGSFVDESQMKALQGKDVIKEDASFFENQDVLLTLTVLIQILKTAGHGLT